MALGRHGRRPRNAEGDLQLGLQLGRQLHRLTRRRQRNFDHAILLRIGQAAAREVQLEFVRGCVFAFDHRLGFGCHLAPLQTKKKNLGRGSESPKRTSVVCLSHACIVFFATSDVTVDRNVFFSTPPACTRLPFRNANRVTASSRQTRGGRPSLAKRQKLPASGPTPRPWSSLASVQTSNGAPTVR